MTKRMSLVEQKRLQWAKEREEIARLNNHGDLIKHQNLGRTTIRTRLSSRDQTSCSRKAIRANGQYGSTTSLQSLEFSAGGSMINILDRNEFSETMRRRSPSLPPIYTKENHTYNSQKISQLKAEGCHYEKVARDGRYKSSKPEVKRKAGGDVPYELEREDETSGYASDSIEASATTHHHQHHRQSQPMIDECERMSERTWKNPYPETPNTASSKACSMTRLGELNRPRWGSLWQGSESSRDPPPPSWLERGLSRLDNSSQILVINHESASSPDSSTTGSSNSDSKTYLRGHNIPIDMHILQEREVRRQKALELQNAIKQQLEENDKKRKEEKEKRQQEEREEEERIKKERYLEQKRLEEEGRRVKEKEEAKMKKEEAMREILETAERLAREEKRQRRQRNNDLCDNIKLNDVKEVNDHSQCKPATLEENQFTTDRLQNNNSHLTTTEQYRENIKNNINNISDNNVNLENEKYYFDKNENDLMKKGLLRLPVSKEVAIVLTGRLEDSELLNLVVSADENSGRKKDNSSVNAFVRSIQPLAKNSSCSPRDKSIEYRLLTPSKYRTLMGRDCATQTDGENESNDVTIKDRKEIINRKNIEKGTNTSMNEERCTTRSKSQPRTSLDSRPRWNANRPGTRYRTQSEKDPHYQKRLRMRRRRVESSDDRSRSPSSERRKMFNIKSKLRNLTRRKVKHENYDADLSMDSLNSVIPLKIDEHGRINIHQIERNNNNNNKLNEIVDDNVSVLMEKKEMNDKVDLYCGHDIISQLVSLRNGLLAKQQEWDPERCLISPSTDFY